MGLIIRKESKSRVTSFHFEADTPGEMREAILRLETMKRFWQLPSGCELPARDSDSLTAVVKMKTTEADRRNIFCSFELDGEKLLRWNDMPVEPGRKAEFPERPAFMEWAGKALKRAANGGIKRVECEGSIVWIDFGFDSRSPAMCGDWAEADSPGEAIVLFGNINREIAAREERKDGYGELLDAVRSAVGHFDVSGDSACREVGVSVRLFPRPAVGDRYNDSEEFKVVIGDVDAPAFVGKPSADGEGNGAVLIPRKSLPDYVKDDPDSDSSRIVGRDEFRKVVEDAIKEYKGMFYAPRPMFERPTIDEDEIAVDQDLNTCRKGGAGEVDWDRFFGYMRAELGDDADAYLELSRKREGE